MNRRNFIKRGALWVPTIFIPSAIRGQDLYVNKLKMLMQQQKAAAGGGGGQAAAYIGNNLDGSGNIVTDSGTDSVSTVTAWNLSFTCPGSGTRVLDELAMWCRSTAGTTHYRVALYTGAGAFVAQSGQVAVTSATVSWVTTSSFFNQALASLSPVNITGGSSYILACSAEGGQCEVHFKTIVGGGFNANPNAYSVGFPANLPSSTTTNEEFSIRGHVAAV